MVQQSPNSSSTAPTPTAIGAEAAGDPIPGQAHDPNFDANDGPSFGATAGPTPGSPRKLGWWRPFWRGFLATLPLQIATLPFAVVFGVLAVEAGLDFAQIMGFVLIVVAGASSFVALELLQEQGSALLIILTSALVNLRMVMYSAGLTPHWSGAGPGARLAAGYFLNDQTYAVSVNAYQAGEMPILSDRIAYFFGSGCCCIPIWTAMVMIGVFLGNQIPSGWGEDMAVPALFLALSAPMVRTPAHMIAMLSAIAAALLLSALPQGVAVIGAAFAGIAAGMGFQRLIPGRAP